MLETRVIACWFKGRDFSAFFVTNPVYSVLLPR